MNSFQTKPLFETSNHYEVWKNDFEDLLKVINVLNDFQIQYFYITEQYPIKIDGVS